MGMPYLE
jgi:hypothetical protein